jgi:Anthrone oxygenase
MLVKLIQFTTIMLYVLVAGVMWGTWLSLGRTMTRYDGATFLADGKHMIANLATIMAVLMISAIVFGLLATWLLFRRRSSTAGWLALAGLLLMVAVIVVTLAVEVPIDNKIKTWTVATLPPDWQDIRARWAAFHTLRTFLSLAAVAAAVGAALTTRPAAPLSPIIGQREPASPTAPMAGV